MFDISKLIKSAAVSLVCTSSIGVLAADKSCLIEGAITIAGKTTQIKDCLENSGLPDDRFKSVCQSLVQSSEGLAKSFGGTPPKTTYLPSCPPASTGACVGLFDQPMTSYYYKRDAMELAETKESCVATGGKWRQ